MSFFTILPEELMAVTKLRHETQLVYLAVIVPNRNRAGIAVGRLPEAPYALTYPGMMQALTVDGRQGLKGSTVDKSFVRRVVDELVRNNIVRLRGRDLLDGLECLIFNEYSPLHLYSVQNKPDTNPTPKVDTNPTPENAENTEACEWSFLKADTSKTEKADTFTVTDNITNTVLSKYVVTDKSVSNFHANNYLLTEQQQAYWQVITSLNIFRLQTLFRAEKLDAYAAMLGRWEAAQVKTEGLQALLITIHNEACKSGKTVHSPLYFEHPVIRLTTGGKNHETDRNAAKQSTILDQLDLAARYGYA